MLQPFVPRSRDDSVKNLSAFMVAKMDPDNYGQLEAYVMPRARTVDGPALVNSRINQDPAVSQEITLLDTAGSKVRLGNLLVIPIEQSLLYIRPLYVEATGTPLPQLKKVIVVFGDRVVMRDSFREAMTVLFPGSTINTLEQQGGGQTSNPVQGQPPPPEGATPAPTIPTGVAELLTQAGARFQSAEDALRAGDLATYQRLNNEGRDLVRRATDEARASAAPAPTTATTRPAA
jgi:hypothetical protein